MTSRREQLKSEIFRRQVRQHMDAGHSVARTARELGKSERHVKNIMAQEKQAKAAGEG